MSNNSHKLHCTMHTCEKCKQCGQTTTVAQRKDAFISEKRSMQYGQERAKGQPLNDKITRGDFFGKKWFPFGAGGKKQ